MPIDNKSALTEAVRRIVRETPVLDMHTHIYDAGFGDLLLRGPDELLAYHYMTAELFRCQPRKADGSAFTPEEYYTLSKREQADWAWRELFLARAPLSEAARGVLTCLKSYSGDPVGRDLAKHRATVAGWSAEKHIDEVFTRANVSTVVMTNDPFDDLERPVWEKGCKRDPRFLAALRLDPILVDWPGASRRMAEWGFKVGADFSKTCVEEGRRFLRHWIGVMKPAYLAASTGYDFDPYGRPAQSAVFHKIIMPVCAELKLPVALMIGVEKLTNPRLRLAGDGVKRADLAPLSRLCADYPDQRFLVTLLSRENQHELYIMARKFANMLPFGCWWFLNDPVFINEMTRMRMELLGPTFVPQHSDARVLDQLIYKWSHSRTLIGEVLVDKYADMFDAGWRVEEAEIRRDVERLFSGNFLEAVGRK